MDEESLKKNLTERASWERGLYVLFFAIVYHFAEVVMYFFVIVQVLWALFTGRPNERLASAGRRIADYLRDLVLFMTYNSQEKPFPFSDFPADASGRSLKKADRQKKE